MKTIDNEERLMQRFCDTQSDLTKEQARVVARKVLAADSDIRDAAVSWAETGVMQEGPVVEGRTPADLSRSYDPTQTFTILIALRADPVRAKASLRTFPGRSARSI